MSGKPRKVTDKKTTVTAAAKTLGITPQSLSRSLKRHGVTAGKDGMYDAVKVFEAARAGAIQDKNALASSAEPSDELHKKKLVAQIRLIDHQADRAKVEVEKLRGELIPLEDHRARVLAVYGFAVRSIDTWIKTVSAARADAGLKHELEELRRRVYAGLQAEANPDD